MSFFIVLNYPHVFGSFLIKKKIMALCFLQVSKISFPPFVPPSLCYGRASLKQKVEPKIQGEIDVYKLFVQHFLCDFAIETLRKLKNLGRSPRVTLFKDSEGAVFFAL